jgi:hypothetical protein
VSPTLAGLAGFLHAQLEMSKDKCPAALFGGNATGAHSTSAALASLKILSRQHLSIEK